MTIQIMILLTKTFKSMKIILLMAMVLTLTACSGNKVVVTTDDSADYQSAIELPPLKKDVENPVSTESAEQNSVTNTDITISILQISDSTVRMNIDAEIDQAWDYLLNEIPKSEITLQGRNRAANLVEIGCGYADDRVIETNEGGWSIFNNDIIHEYCVLQLDERRGQTEVLMLDRRGNEVSSADAMPIFTKLVNN